MIADVAILASLAYASWEAEVEIVNNKMMMKEVVEQPQVLIHPPPPEQQQQQQQFEVLDRAMKTEQSVTVRQRNQHPSNTKKHMKISNNHRKEHHFHIQQPAGRK